MSTEIKRATHIYEWFLGNREQGPAKVKGVTMAWGNAVLSRTQYDVESCLTGRGCQAEVPTCATAEPNISLSTAASRGRQAMDSKV
jgi:hypothetical protein